MRRTLFALLVSLLASVAGAQWVDYGARRQPIPPTDNADLRWLDAALYDSGFIFNDAVRQAYYDHCMRLVTSELHFSEATWLWLEQHPAVFNATFALEYPPNPNVIHNFVKLAKLVGPAYAEKYQQLLIAFAVSWRSRSRPSRGGPSTAMSPSPQNPPSPMTNKGVCTKTSGHASTR